MASEAKFIETKYVHQNGPYTCRGTVKDFGGNMYVTADVSAVKMSVLEQNELNPNQYTPVTGYNNISLATSVIATRTGTDSDGETITYNFEYDLPTGTTPAFPKRGWRYIVHFEITPVTGRPTVIEAELLTLE